jgi:prepilin-type N-terminal cleavage/methylation domain-containing protein
MNRGQVVSSIRNRDGFSLVELIVSMLVLSLALLAIGQVMVSTARLQQNAESRMEYVALGDGKLDQLRSYAALRAPDTVQLSLGGSLTSDVTGKSEQVTSDRGRPYTIRWHVTQGLNGTRSVTVRVAPVNPGRSEMRHMDLRALMAME